MFRFLPFPFFSRFPPTEQRAPVRSQVCRPFGRNNESASAKFEAGHLIWRARGWTATFAMVSAAPGYHPGESSAAESLPARRVGDVATPRCLVSRACGGRTAFGEMSRFFFLWGGLHERRQSKVFFFILSVQVLW